MEVTELVKSVRWVAEELHDEKRGFEAKICRLAAERLEELDDKCTEFAGILPACEGCSGKTAIGERTKDCVYEVDGAYCMDRARKNYFALKARAEEAEAEVARLKKILNLYALQYGTVSEKGGVTDD